MSEPNRMLSTPVEVYKGSHESRQKRLVESFNFTYRYIDDVLSLNNEKFSEYLEFFYPRELEIKHPRRQPLPYTWIYTSILTMESSLLGFTGQ